MPTIEIQALDTLFFRDAKPFDMGDDNWAEGIFPPPPSVIYGALRSAYFAENLDKIVLANTDSDPTKELTIKNILIKKGDDLFSPSPLDYVRQKDDNDKNFPLKLIPSSLFKHNYALKYIPYPAIIKNDEIKTYNVESINKYIEITDFKTIYLNEGLEEDLVFTDSKKIYQIEPKIGIGLNNLTRSSSDGKLYRVGMLRMNEDENEDGNFEKTQIVVEYDFGFDFIPKKLRFGAENKISQVINGEMPDLSIKLNDSNYLKIILKTPAFFNKGWNPNLEKRFPDLHISLIAAFVGKSQNYGGWNIADKTPKIMKKAVPAGSVFYYKIDENQNSSEVMNLVSSMLSISEDRANEGFGLFSIGNLLFDELLIKKPW